MNRILEFNYNNVKYYLDYDNKFICSKEIDGIISYNLSDEEKILIQKALEESINVEDLVYLDEVYLKDEVYKHYYDSENSLHVFFTKDNNIPNLEAFKTLNLIYNDSTPYIELLDKNIDKVSNSLFHRNIILFNSLITTNIYLNNLYKIIHYSILKHKNFKKIRSDINNHAKDLPKMDVLALLFMIKTKKNLTQEEKNILYGYKDFIEDNFSNFNMDDLTLNLLKFSVRYSSSHKGGFWQYSGDKMYQITVGRSDHLESKNMHILTHEFIHMFSDKEKLIKLNLGSAFYEWLNVVINNEYNINYFEEEPYDNAYDWLNDLGNLMIELFDQENLFLFHARPDVKILINELYNIMGNQKIGYELFNTLDEYNKAYIALHFKKNELKSIEEWQRDLDINYNKAKLLIRMIYEKKYNCSIEDNAYDFYLYDKYRAALKICEQNPNYTFSFLHDSEICNYKPIFNKRLPEFKFVLKNKVNNDKFIIDEGILKLDGGSKLI